MTIIDIRRLRVRDDGTGRPSDVDAEFSEFSSEDAVVLLGDPGMGKTTMFKRLAGKAYQTVRHFLISPIIPSNQPIFIDALDEYRRTTGGRGTVDEVVKSLIDLGRPRFRISCRAVDWFGGSDLDVIRLASATGRVVVLQLRPLSEAEILEAVEGTVPDPVAFVREAHQTGLGRLLTNPQTLLLVAKAWTSGRKPRNKYEAFEIGITALAQEVNDEHASIDVGALNHAGLRHAAAAAASVLLLSNAEGISRAETKDRDRIIGIATIPHDSPREAVSVLSRRIFMSSETDFFEFVHRTIAEFLAAEDLSRRVKNGLPIDRVMALMCGHDGIPVSSLRGLFAWFVTHLGPVAELYIARDPYGVATYGDPTVLSPSGQRAIWEALRELEDPWFLSSDDDRGSFNNLANEHTTPTIESILVDSESSIHLKIAALEAIANSPTNVNLASLVRSMVLDRGSNNWLRSTALKAFAASINGNPLELRSLDADLSESSDDIAAAEVRVPIASMLKGQPGLSEHILSILAQAASSKSPRRTFGLFYPLIGLPSDEELDAILDGTSKVLVVANQDRYELRAIFTAWLKRRLDSHKRISEKQLATWLRSVTTHHERDSDIHASLKAVFQRQEDLFGATFEFLAATRPSTDGSFWLFVAHDLWELLPTTVWPIPPANFFLQRCSQENNPERAGDLFKMFMSFLPPDGNPKQVEDAWEIIERRPDLESALGVWTVCEIPKWRLNRIERAANDRREEAKTRAANIDYLNRRLPSIQSGKDQVSLQWAAEQYLGLFGSNDTEGDPKARIARLSTNELADALLEGSVLYLDQPNIPSKDDILGWWLANRYPRTQFLLWLSVFLRQLASNPIPPPALPTAIASILMGFPTGAKISNFDEVLRDWFFAQIQQDPCLVATVAKEFWLNLLDRDQSISPQMFHELRSDAASQGFLTDLAAEVLTTTNGKNHYAAAQLVGALLATDRRRLQQIGISKLDDRNLSPELKAIWLSALFVADGGRFTRALEALVTDDKNLIWYAIEMIGTRHNRDGGFALTVDQRATLIELIGSRFENSGLPAGGWSGNHNPWDATEFVTDQVNQLASDHSADADALLAKLEQNVSISSYHEYIRHRRSQRDRQLRDTGFSFSPSEAVAKALQNLEPANSDDLLALIVDHIQIMGAHIRNSPTERYRAYWNERGKSLLSPKHEEVCSGLLADDLQARLNPIGLIVTVEHHMVEDKECDVVVLQGTERILPIEVKHHYNPELWTGWHTQLEKLYTRDPKAGGRGIYLVLWSGEEKQRKMPTAPEGLSKPSSPQELKEALESLIPEKDRQRLRIVILDISSP